VGATLASARSLSIELGGSTVVSEADLDVRAGEVVALVGPNGAGKSTLLGALAGDIPAASGTVTIDGRPLADWSATELAMRRAVLPQQVTVSFPFVVREVVRMGRAPWARTRHADEDDAVIDTTLAQTDATRFGHRPFLTLSGGERARVALARICAQRTQLMLWDEPTAALDVHHQELVLGLARSLAADGVGVVVVLHDLGSAARWSDRVVLLDRGRIVADGAPGTVLESSTLSRVYDHRLEVLEHPRTGVLLVVPVGPTAASCPERRYM
jgi:iron complex transport system ATP-binding protein